MAQNVLSISEFEDFNEWKRDGNVIRNSDGSYSTQDANFRNRLEDMEELQRYYKREFVGSYAKGGKMENMYKIVDIDGDTVESNLNEQEVIEFADSLGYYEAQDNEEEPIYDIDSAISLIEMEGDYTVVKMSEYGGSVYADGGGIESLREEIQSKYGLRLEGNRVRTNFKSTAYEIAKKYDGEVQEDGSYYVVVFNEFAKGGKVAKFDAYEVSGELAELADGVWDKLGITDGGTLYNDESLQAKVNEEYAKAGIDKMFKALSTVNRKKVAEALTDENNHNLRNYLALRGYLGVAEKRSYTKLFKESGNFKIVLNPTIFGVKPLVSDISTYVPHSKVLSITIKKGDKEYKLTGSDILDGVYVKDGEFKRGGVMKTLRRWWKKLNGTWYYNEGAGWRRDRKFQNKSEKYEKDGRRTYKQVTRGYVDDMPYEYAKGGYVDMREKLTKELMKLQRELMSHRLSTYIEGDTSEEEMARSRERESKLARFNDILKTLNEMDKSPKYAKGGDVTVPEKIEYSSMFSAIPRSTDNENVV